MPFAVGMVIVCTLGESWGKICTLGKNLGTLNERMKSEHFYVSFLKGIELLTNKAMVRSKTQQR